MGSSEEGKPKKSRFYLGVGAALVDGFLLALWSLSTKLLGSEQPTALHYGAILVTAGLGYFALALATKRSQRVLRISKASAGILVTFSLISALQFSLGVLLFEYESAQLAISALLRNSSLIFSAILCQCAFLCPGLIPTKRIDMKALSGIVLFSAACWLYVGMPRDSASWLAAISAWGLISVWIGFNRALTEILTLAMTKHTNRFSMNVSLALWHVLIGGLCCLYHSFTVDESTHDKELSLQAWCGLLGVALIIPLAQGFRFISLSVLEDVVGKKGISIWMFLFSSMLIAALLLHEAVSQKMVYGLSLALVAVVLLEPGLYSSLMHALKRLFRL